MDIDKIRIEIAEKLSNDFDAWNDVLNNTNPGNYGCDQWDVEIDFNDIYVDIPKRSFELTNGIFSADLVLGASKGDTSFNMGYNKVFNAFGKFKFENANSITIEEVDIEIDPDIFGED